MFGASYATALCLIVGTAIVLCRSTSARAAARPYDASNDLRARTDAAIRRRSVARCFAGSSDARRSPRAPVDEPYRYAAVIDAGSSGSRIQIYRWPTPKSGGRVALEAPGLKQVNKTKVEPGLSDHAESLASVDQHIGELLTRGAADVPEHLRRSTPAYVMATAGMRTLLEDRTNTVMRHVDSLMRNQSFNPFQYRPHSVRILSGEEEGVFAWIAVNYLIGAFDIEGPQVPPVGILEMGGASTQIAFEPEGHIMQGKFPVLIGSSRHALYVRSYLDFGTNAIIRRVQELLVADLSDSSAKQVYNPCMLKGYSQKSTTTGVEFIGTSDPNGCVSILHRIVHKVEARECQQKPCGIGPYYQPSVPVNLPFYAVGSFQHTLPKLEAVDVDKVYVPSKGFEKAFNFCGRDYNDVLNSSHEPERRYISNRCIIGLYSAVLFTRGYGFSNDTKLIRVSNEMKGRPLDWTLGAVLYEDELDAIFSCGQGKPMVGAVTDSSVRQSVVVANILLLVVFIVHAMQFMA